MSSVNNPSPKKSTLSRIPWRLWTLWTGLSLGWEIFIAVMIKLALIVCIKIAFFSDAIPKADIANEVENVFQNAPLIVPPTSTNESLSTERKHP